MANNIAHMNILIVVSDAHSNSLLIQAAESPANVIFVSFRTCPAVRCSPGEMVNLACFQLPLLLFVGTGQSREIASGQMSWQDKA